MSDVIRVRTEVERQLGRPVPDPIWADLERRRLPGDVSDGGSSIDELAEEVRATEAMIAATREPRSKRTRREVPPDRRARALAQIVAQRVAARPSVAAFRRSVLRGNLVQPEPQRVADWVRRRARAEGKPTPYRHERVDGVSERFDSLAFPDVDEQGDPCVRQVLLAAGGALARLKGITRELAQVFGWDEPAAVAFVVADVTPELPLARISVVERFLPQPIAESDVDSNLGAPLAKGEASPGLARVVLDIDPRLDPDQVKRLYREARRQIRAQTRSTLEQKTAELAVFIDGANDGWPWSEAHEAWSEAHPEWAYPGVSAFRRAARDAYARVLGVKLNWARPPGRRPRGRKS